MESAPFSDEESILQWGDGRAGTRNRSASRGGRLLWAVASTPCAKDWGQLSAGEDQGRSMQRDQRGDEPGSLPNACSPAPPR